MNETIKKKISPFYDTDHLEKPKLAAVDLTYIRRTTLSRKYILSQHFDGSIAFIKERSITQGQEIQHFPASFKYLPILLARDGIRLTKSSGLQDRKRKGRKKKKGIHRRDGHRPSLMQRTQMMQCA